MDDVLCDYSSGFKSAILSNPEIKYPQSQYGFFRRLKPIANGISSVRYLDLQNEFEVYILTAPSIKNPLCYVEKRLWIEDYFGTEMVEKMIISPNKGLNKGDYLIDDNDTGKGQDKFEGKLLKFGSKEFKNWKVIVEYFKITYNLK